MQSFIVNGVVIMWLWGSVPIGPLSLWAGFLNTKIRASTLHTSTQLFLMFLVLASPYLRITRLQVVLVAPLFATPARQTVKHEPLFHLLRQPLLDIGQYPQRTPHDSAIVVMLYVRFQADRARLELALTRA